MKTRRYALMGTAGMLLLLAVLLAACGGSSSGNGGIAGSDDTEVSGGKPDSGTMDTGIPQSAGDAEISSGAQDVVAQGSATASESQTQSISQAMPNDFGRKIVKSANLGVRSEDVRGSAAEAQQVAARFGGIVLNSQVSQLDPRKEGRVYADLVLSVPSEEFENALTELRGLGKKVTDDSVAGQDVTEEFVDLESRERNLLAAERSLLELFDRAQSVDDTLYIQRELTALRGEIELVQGRIKYLEQRSAFSQITLSIQPVAALTPPPKQPAWDPGAVAAKAWAASLNVLQGAATVAISAAVFGWWLSPLLIIGLVWWRRRNQTTSPAGTS
ncbi:MAG: DUF4349 domain-containing protein [Rubrobacter sp.]|nr:DUF4349 domain-containing protein [Rubrobacter sp.]